MRILHVIDSLRMGGSESLVATLAGAFARRGVDSVVCGLGEDGPLRERLAREGIASHHLDRRLGVRPDVMARLGMLMLRERCDVVMTHHYRQLFHALPGAVLLRRRLVHVEHDSHSYAAQPGLADRLARMATSVHRFCFVSDEINDWFTRNMPSAVDKFTVIRNGVDTDRFAPDPGARATVRRRLGIDDAAVVIGTCARLEPVKDLPLLIRSFARLDGNAADCHLVVAGDGSLRAELEGLARELGVDGRCHFTGVVADVPELLGALDLYAITSSNEGLPLSVLEAMSAALPVVSVDVGALADVVDDRVGVLLGERSPEACAAALGRLVRDPGLRRELGAAGRALVTERFSLDAMVTAYLDVIGAR